MKTAWEKVQIARQTQRPKTTDYIKNIFNDFIEFHGDRNFGDDKAIIGGIALLDEIPVTVSRKIPKTNYNIYRYSRSLSRNWSRRKRPR